MMEKLIYIIDDEALIGGMLQMLLKGSDSSWEVKAFEEPSDLIRAVAGRPPNVVIADYRMPVMTGTELQDKVRVMSPATIRILMSGNISNLNKITSAHQFIAKPFLGDEVVAVVTNSLKVQERLRPHAKLGEIISGLRSLPVVPAIFNRLIALLDQDTSTTQEIAFLLAQDGGIMTRIIQLSNSSLFNHGAVVTGPEEAILCLGLRNIKAVVLSLHIFDSYHALIFPETSVQGIWQHCLRTAQLAEELCRKMEARDHATDAFLASLLHDLGRLVLMENMPDQYPGGLSAGGRQSSSAPRS